MPRKPLRFYYATICVLFRRVCNTWLEQTRTSRRNRGRRTHLNRWTVNIEEFHMEPINNSIVLKVVWLSQPLICRVQDLIGFISLSYPDCIISSVLHLPSPAHTLINVHHIVSHSTTSCLQPLLAITNRSLPYYPLCPSLSFCLSHEVYSCVFSEQNMIAPIIPPWKDPWNLPLHFMTPSWIPSFGWSSNGRYHRSDGIYHDTPTMVSTSSAAHIPAIFDTIAIRIVQNGSPGAIFAKFILLSSCFLSFNFA